MKKVSWVIGLIKILNKEINVEVYNIQAFYIYIFNNFNLIFTEFLKQKSKNLI